MKSEAKLTRRNFVRGSGLAGTGLVLAGSAAAQTSGALPLEERPEDRQPGSVSEQEVSPGEDLMREHGVLKRVLLVYGECVRRLDSGQDVPPEAIAGAATIIRTFIEDYHEKLEEDFLFPRFRQADVHVRLVDVLTEQHRAGRSVTDQIVRLATLQSIKDAGECKELSASLKAFIRMYEPHEAREDTVLFPALRKVVTAREYAALGEDFEKKEHQLFGEDGFERIVNQVAGIERTLGIYDLAQFTPR